MNRIWNTHFSGSPLWNLFSPGAERIMGSYKRSIKSMMQLPLANHLYLLKPLSGEKPAMANLANRFMDKINKTDKAAINMLKREVMKEVRSISVANFMIMSGESTIQKVNRDNTKKDDV